MTRRLGRYEIHEAIGAGGMAEVFRATLQGPEGFAKEVALKLLPRELVSRDKDVRFLINEARIGGQLKHRNIVEVYELGQVDGEWFVAMELVRGRTLEQIHRQCRLTRTALPRCVTLEIAMQIATGLHYAHSARTRGGRRAGLVHRDLKPSNVMVTDRGLVKVMDFGMARSSTSFYVAGHGGGAAGTPLYMSPEVLAGKPVTAAADIFSFGVLLYEMLTTQRLFVGPDVQIVLARVLRMDVEARLEPIAAVDPGLARLLRACLERDVSRRLPSARELFAELTELRMADPCNINLAEFCTYLQLGPQLGLVRQHPDNTWSWPLRDDDDTLESIDLDEASVSVRSSIGDIAGELAEFGAGFFGPVVDPDTLLSEIRMSDDGEVPPYRATLLPGDAAPPTGRRGAS